MAEVARRALLVGLGASGAATAATGMAHDFSLPTLEGGTLDPGAFRGRALMVVNTASFCGYTPHYAGLQRLHDRFAGPGLVLVRVP